MLHMHNSTDRIAHGTGKPPQRIGPRGGSILQSKLRYFHLVKTCNHCNHVNSYCAVDVFICNLNVPFRIFLLACI